jgi:anti-sigma B factor antagonist
MMARILLMPGDMDAAAMRAQRSVCEALADGDEDVSVDMSKVSFVDSSGVGAIVYMYKRLVANGHSLRLTGVKGQPLQLLTYLKLTDLINR